MKCCQTYSKIRYYQIIQMHLVLKTGVKFKKMVKDINVFAHGT
jgi:hypothetical protein